MPVRYRYIRSVVERLLDAHQVTRPAVDPEGIARQLGVQVRFEPADDDLSGFLLYSANRAMALIGVNSSHSERRRRFTLGHELGHYLLHRKDSIHVDRSSAGFKLRSTESSKGTDEEEIEANVFAAELLMPARYLARDLAEVDVLELVDEDRDSSEIARLADRYQVSVRAMTFRLANLGYIRL